MSELRFAMLGAGFWARYQLAAWGEVAGARCVAVCDPDRGKAEHLAWWGKAKPYTDPDVALREERPDFVDIVTPPDTHAALIRLAAGHRVPVICQKPLAPTLEVARAVTAECQSAGVPLLVHENWRWQTPLRAVKHAIETGVIGRVFRGRVTFANSFPVFDNQPAPLRDAARFILADIGTHILDAARHLFGEADSLYCVTRKVRADIRGEDVATVLLRTTTGAAVTCEMSYASRVEHDRFPETFVLAEGDKGSVELGPDYWVRVTTAGGTQANRYPPPRYDWADPRYDLVQASMVPCLRHLLSSLWDGEPAQTTAADNLKTLELVFGAYESAATGRVVHPGGDA